MGFYKKVANSGRVPYPDHSGKFLSDDEIVSGEEWLPLVALGFVEEIKVIKEEKSDILNESESAVKESAQENVNAVNDGIRSEEVDREASGGTGSVPRTNPRTPGRRGPRG